jgi:hypothetical protein
MRTTFALLLALAPLPLLSGCSSGGGAGSGSRTPAAAAPEESSQPASGAPGSLWERLDAARTARKGGAEEAFDPNAGAAGIPVADRARMEGWWKLFVAGDAGWPAAKAQWRALKAPGPQILAENLLRRHVIAYDSRVRSEYERTRRELVEMRDVAGPLVVNGLAAAAGDTLVRQHAADLVGAMGPAVLPEVERALSDAAPQGRWELVRAVGRMKDPATTPFLSRVARGGGAFEPRIEAIKGLAQNGDAAGFAAVAAGLEDGDASVRKFSARYLPAYGRADAGPKLLAYMERCERERDREGVAEAHGALQKLTQLDMPAESGAWRAALKGTVR